ncbi:sugar ABC transporter ATP-binding protein [Pisciglobus halotolerans]|uniref:Ribose ABC transporter ATP-binding protein n=1 Tax=Pisciglobus halotolerans TaxID=745365 RepID=A0A1I3AY40_9LACT|nr:sugar ABC transporter ATP-binding protein [Pisciglobus halotolerans]SFH54902.1 ribose ABC transporter ATP-binding protein [Pisciglobus halotolerans]
MEVKMTGITKSFGHNSVLRGVDFGLHAGEVHALMGENGAGKSTLMNILTGLHTADSGEILVNGSERTFANPKEAEVNGISFIHQEMNTWADMTVLENLFLGRELKNGIGWIKTKEMKAQAKGVFAELGIHLDLNRDVGTLSVGQQQMIEIAKSLMTNAEVIIMDEPTAALTEREIDVLFTIIEKLKSRNVAIIYISHRMEEIFRISDRITVMRDGVSVATKNTKETHNDEIVRMMVGRDLEDYYPEKHAEIGEVVFEAKQLGQEKVFKNISFQVKAGEIVGFSGLMGAGRTEVMRSIFGIDPLDEGELYLEGEKLLIKSPHDAIRKGIGFLTENRKDEGLILEDSICDNISLPSIDGFKKHLLIDTKAEHDFADMLMKRLNVKAMTREDPASSLSGGNQQKVVLAKWVGIGSKVLILDEPTRGVDVGAKREIYQLMNELADRGVAIIMVSSDLPEILGVSDRVLVIHEGKLAGELSRTEATEEKIMTLATGGY